MSRGISFLLLNLNPFLLFIYSVYKICFIKNKEKIQNALVFIGIFICITGLSTYPERGDTVRYLELYNIMPISYEAMINKMQLMYKQGLLFYVIIWLFKILNIPYIVLPTVLSLIVLKIYYIIFREVNTKNFSIFYTITFINLVSVINDLRYSFTISILIFGIFLIYIKNLKKVGIFLIILSGQLHISFYLFPLVLIFFNNKNIYRIKMKNIVMSILLYPIIFFISGLFKNKIFIFFKLYSYLKNGDTLKILLFNKYASIILILNLIIFILLIIYLSKHPYKKFKAINNLLVVLANVSIIFIFNSIIFGRISQIFLNLMYILLLNNNRKGKIFKLIIIFLNLKLILILSLHLYGGLIRSWNYDKSIPNYFYQPLIYQIMIDKKFDNNNLNKKIPKKSREVKGV